MGDVPTNWRGVGSLPSISFDLTVDTLNRKTLQTTEARILSGFGWGLTKRIESHGLSRFKANVQRVGIDSFPTCSFASLMKYLQSREGVSLILNLLRQSRLQSMTLGGPEPLTESRNNGEAGNTDTSPTRGGWSRLKSWINPPSPT